MLKILLVDDEPSAIKLLTYIIEHRYKEFEIVGTAENGQEGLEKIALLKPNIVITDVKMPIMDGIELAAHIKQDYPNIYCIIASGCVDILSYLWNTILLYIHKFCKNQIRSSNIKP